MVVAEVGVETGGSSDSGGDTSGRGDCSDHGGSGSMKMEALVETVTAAGCDGGGGRVCSGCGGANIGSDSS